MTGIRLMIALSLLVGFLVSYTFVVESVNALYRKRANADGAPKWFIKGWDILIIGSIFALAISYVASYSTQTGAGFWVWYAILNMVLVVGGLMTLWAIVDIRKSISLAESQSKKQIIRTQSNVQLDITIQRQSSHSDTAGAGGAGGGTPAGGLGSDYNSSDINESNINKIKRTKLTKVHTMELESRTVDSKAVEEELKKLSKFKEGRRKLDIIMIGIIGIIGLSCM